MVRFFRSKKVLKDHNWMVEKMKNMKIGSFQSPKKYEDYVPKLWNIDEEMEKLDEKIFELHGVPRLTSELFEKETFSKTKVKFDPGVDITRFKKLKIEHDIRELQREMNWFESVKKKDPSYNYSKKYYKHYKEMMQEMEKLKSQRKNLK